MLKLSDKNKLRLLILGILIVSGLWVSAFYLLCEYLGWIFLLTILLAFMLLHGLVEKCYEKWPNKFFKTFSFFINVFLAFFGILFNIGIPLVIIILAFFIIALFTFGIPLLFLLMLKEFNILLLEKETIIFVSLTLGAILCSNSYKSSKTIIHLFPTIFDRKSYKEELAVYLVHPSNVVFVLYLAYLLYLGITGYLYIEEGIYLISEKMDAAILKAFLVYVAFTNMITKSKDIELNEKDLLERLLLILRNGN